MDSLQSVWNPAELIIHQIQIILDAKYKTSTLEKDEQEKWNCQLKG